MSSCKIWQSVGDSMFLYKTQSSAKKRTDDLIFSGRSLIKMRNRTGPKTDPWGTRKVSNKTIKVTGNDGHELVWKAVASYFWMNVHPYLVNFYSV